MAIQITIVGLGQIGASMGLALANRPELLRRVGHDRDLKTARQAEKLGALDRVEMNLPKAVRGADLVVLSLPVDQIHFRVDAAARTAPPGDDLRLYAQTQVRIAVDGR